MALPTSRLLVDIINFVMSDQKVVNTLELRDKDKGTWGSQVGCRLYKVSPTNKRLAAYLVDFTYITDIDRKELNDDVSILVEVNHLETPEFKILDVRFY